MAGLAGAALTGGIPIPKIPDAVKVGAGIAVTGAAVAAHRELISKPRADDEEEVRRFVAARLPNFSYDSEGDLNAKEMLRHDVPRRDRHQEKLAIALDKLNVYLKGASSLFHSQDRSTRNIIITLLHTWLLQAVRKQTMMEPDMREMRGIISICKVTMDSPLLDNHYTSLLGMKNRDFKGMIAETRDNIKTQLDLSMSECRSCADLCKDIIDIFHNVKTEVVSFLLHMSTTWDGLDNDEVFSIDFAVLLRSHPEHQPHEPTDSGLRNALKHHWPTDVGQLLWAMLQLDEAKVGARDVSKEKKYKKMLEEVRQKWQLRELGNAGLAKFMESQENRERFLETMDLCQSLVYINARFINRFESVGVKLGDYGLCIMSELVRNVLADMKAKTKALGDNLLKIESAFDHDIRKAAAYGLRIPTPRPTDTMIKKANESYFHLIDDVEGHTPEIEELVHKINELAKRSDERRLPEIASQVNHLVDDVISEFNSKEYRKLAGKEWQGLRGSPVPKEVLELEEQKKESKAGKPGHMHSKNEHRPRSASCHEDVSVSLGGDTLWLEQVASESERKNALQERLKKPPRRRCRSIGEADVHNPDACKSCVSMQYCVLQHYEFGKVTGDFYETEEAAIAKYRTLPFTLASMVKAPGGNELRYYGRKDGVVDAQMEAWWRKRVMASLSKPSRGHAFTEPSEPEAIVLQVDGHGEVVVKEAPHAHGRVIVKVPNGEHVKTLEEMGDRTKIRWQGKEGWVKSRNLQKLEEEEPEEHYDRVPTTDRKKLSRFRSYIPEDEVEELKALPDLDIGAGSELKAGDRVMVVKESRMKGKLGTVLESNWHNLVKIEMDEPDFNGRIKSYSSSELVAQR